MVITILEAHVEEKYWSDLQNDFGARTADLPPQMIRTYLLQDTNDPAFWRIVSVWQSQDALNQMRNSGETPTGILIFRHAGAEPKLSIFNVPGFAP